MRKRVSSGRLSVMKEVFSLYIDRLKKGKEEVIDLSLPPDFMEIHESDLLFSSPVKLQGNASFADETLFIHLSIQTKAIIPCAICNEPVEVVIEIPNFYHAESEEDIKGAIYNYKDILREQILLELPSHVECHDGSCPERQNMAKFMKKNAEAEEFHPFADL